MPQNTNDFLKQNVVHVPSQSEEGRMWMVVRGRECSECSGAGCSTCFETGWLMPWYCNCPSFRFDSRHYPDEPGMPDCKHIRGLKLLD